MTIKSDFPFRAAVGMDKVLIDYFDKIGKPIENVATLTGSAANTASSVSSAAITSVVTTAATTSTPYGYATQAQADAIVTAINSIITRQALIITAVNALISDRTTDAALLTDTVETLNELMASLRGAGKMVDS